MGERIFGASSIPPRERDWNPRKGRGPGYGDSRKDNRGGVKGALRLASSGQGVARRK